MKRSGQLLASPQEQYSFEARRSGSPTTGSRRRNCHFRRQNLGVGGSGHREDNYRAMDGPDLPRKGLNNSVQAWRYWCVRNYGAFWGVFWRFGGAVLPVFRRCWERKTLPLVFWAHYARVMPATGVRLLPNWPAPAATPAVACSCADPDSAPWRSQSAASPTGTDALLWP